jgi:two-component system, cell cycle sensor histidine kinase and response regulator CckA
MATKTILIVDDNEQYRSLIRDILETEDYHLLEAQDGEAAWAICEKASPPIDLLFTDIVMPKLDGMALAERVQKKFPGTKVIFTSGYSQGSNFSESVENEEVNFMEKPYDPAHLIKKIRNVLKAK